MLRLLLLRHSKAVAFTGRDDHARALTERGRADAALIGAFLAERGIALDLAIHSGAQRTRETLAIALTALTPGVAVSIEPRLYEASGARFLSVLREQADGAKTLLVVGHNPSIAETANRLAGEGSRRALAMMAAKFPTSALAIIDFKTDRWDALAPHAGRLTHFTTPAALGGDDD